MAANGTISQQGIGCVVVPLTSKAGFQTPSTSFSGSSGVPLPTSKVMLVLFYKLL